MKNNNCPKKLAKAIYQKKVETVKSKEKKAVSKAESVGKVVSAKAGNFGKGGAQFPFLRKDGRKETSPIINKVNFIQGG